MLKFGLVKKQNRGLFNVCKYTNNHFSYFHEFSLNFSFRKFLLRCIGWFSLKLWKVLCYTWFEVLLRMWRPIFWSFFPIQCCKIGHKNNVFACRNVRKNSGSVGRFSFFFSLFFVCVCVCVWSLLFSILKKHSSFNIHAFHIFMFTHVFHVPQVLGKKKREKKIQHWCNFFFFF